MINPMQNDKAIDIIKYYISNMDDVSECNEDVVAFTKAVEVITILPEVTEALSTTLTLLKRHYRDGLIDKYDVLLEKLRRLEDDRSI